MRGYYTPARAVMSIPPAPRLRLFVCVLLVAVAPDAGHTRERQHHGVVFERWIRDTFFSGYEPGGYTQKWDIPASVNRRYGRIPVNPKTARYGRAIDLGDALRQFDIHEPFWLVIGYWEPTLRGRRLVNITPIRVEPALWRKLWGPVTRADIEKLDRLIKDRSLSPEEVRQQVHLLKNRPPYNQSLITFNPKIDWKTQRRLQCGLRFADVFRVLAPAADPARQKRPALWGVVFAGSLE